MFYTGKYLHEYYIPFTGKMKFFTGQFIHSQRLFGLWQREQPVLSEVKRRSDGIGNPSAIS